MGLLISRILGKFKKDARIVVSAVRRVTARGACEECVLSGCFV